MIEGQESGGPTLSLVMPCYNEAKVLPLTIPPLLKALEAEKLSYELILVDNGSQDETGQVIEELKKNGNVVRVDVSPNIGYGNGVLNGLRKARGRIVGYMCCDGQIETADVLKVFRSIESETTPSMAKLTRTRRDDGLRRLVITTVYNGFCRLLFPSMRVNDINGTPKFFFRSDLEKMRLQSTSWFLDFEAVMRSVQLGLRVKEIEAPFHKRASGKSHVRPGALLEFLSNIARYRLTGNFTPPRE